MFPLYWKHLMLRTPLERPARKLQHFLGAWEVLRHPELHDVYAEEWDIDRLFQAVVQRDMNCIDIGAHIGSTLSAIVRLAPRGKHLAFEPVPRKAAWLRRKFPEVDVHNLALADTTGNRQFGEDLDHSGLSRILPLGSSQVGQTTVVCERLDNIVDPVRRVGFLKIDVEGAELLALRGGADLLRRDRPTILFESGPGSAEKLGLSREELFAFLTKEMGYSVYLVGDYLRGNAPLDIHAFEQCHTYPFRAFNYVAAS